MQDLTCIFLSNGLVKTVWSQIRFQIRDLLPMFLITGIRLFLVAISHYLPQKQSAAEL